MAFANFKCFKHLTALSQRFQKNKKSMNQENVKVIFHFQLFHLFCRVLFTGCGAWCAVCGAWNAG